jgi:uncharacterized protein YecT (DUF1311 family)
MKDSLMQNVCCWPLLFLLTLYALDASGIDNPDAPDFVKQFLGQANVYEEKLIQGTYSTLEYQNNYRKYEKFLDKELNKAYRLLIEHLDRASQEALKKSQRKWLSYRDAEFDFITSNWNKSNFGSSSVLSRGNYRTALIKQRVVSLYQYLKNYPP